MKDGYMQEVKPMQTTDTSKPHHRGITGSTLKVIAMISMLLDHVGFFLLARIVIQRRFIEVMDQQSFDAFQSAYAGMFFAYDTLRMLGRIAFPIFCFLLVQGFLHTHNLKKYLGRLFLFALISEIPFNLALSGALFFHDIQNVYFTLFLGVLALAGIRIAEEKKEWHMVWRMLFGLMGILLCAGAAVLLKTDYDMLGVFVISILYLLRRKKTLSMALGCATLMKIPAFLALLPVHFYNGQRGSNIKWLFYLFYPAHILLLYFIVLALGLAQVSLF